MTTRGRDEDGFLAIGGVLGQSAASVRAVGACMDQGLMIVDADGVIEWLNVAGEQLLGWTAADLAGRRMDHTVHYKTRGGDPRELGESSILRGLRAGVPTASSDDLFVRRDGGDIHVDVQTAPLRDDGCRPGAVLVFSDSGARRRERLERETKESALHWLREMRDAFEEERFAVFAQPAVDLRTGIVHQHELLIRLHDRDGELVNPGEFLPIAEEYGMIAEIDRWMVGQAARLASRGHRVSVNLSAQSVGSSAMVEHFISSLAAEEADPRLVMVELTETALLEDEDAAIDFITAIKLVGSHLALDDFGTGYGGFSYIKRLPVDHLKIDIEFVRDLATNAGSRNVVQAVVNLARGFDLGTIAEGVESEEVLDMLRDYGVDLAQGYAIARPLPVEQAMRGVV